MKEILFGAAYYLEYMPYDRLKEDLDMMQQAGMNTIRIAESTWSTLEPTDGEFDFSYIDRVLEEAQKRKMNVIIGTPTYAIPSWLEKKCPEVMVHITEGQRRPDNTDTVRSWINLFSKYAERVICKLAEHTPATHPGCDRFS